MRLFEVVVGACLDFTFRHTHIRYDKNQRLTWLLWTKALKLQGLAKHVVVRVLSTQTQIFIK